MGQSSSLSKLTPGYPACVCVSPSVLLNSPPGKRLSASAPPRGCPSGAHSPADRMTGM